MARVIRTQRSGEHDVTIAQKSRALLICESVVEALSVHAFYVPSIGTKSR
jgi:hypothetical protein